MLGGPVWEVFYIQRVGRHHCHRCPFIDVVVVVVVVVVVGTVGGVVVVTMLLLSRDLLLSVLDIIMVFLLSGLYVLRSARRDAAWHAA